MQDHLLFSSLPIEQLKAELTETIRTELKAIVSILPTGHQQTEFITRKEAATLLGVSLPTLNEWQKQGIVQGYRISSRIRYKRGELETALIRIKSAHDRRERKG